MPDPLREITIGDAPGDVVRIAYCWTTLMERRGLRKRAVWAPIAFEFVGNSASAIHRDGSTSVVRLVEKESE